jgi:hypothetical protein
VFKVIATPQSFRLDDYEAFATLLLSLTLRGIVKEAVTPPPPPPTHSDNLEGAGLHDNALDARAEPFNVVFTPIGTPSVDAELPAVLRKRFTFSMPLADGLDRVFRSWFEDPVVQPTPATYSHLTKSNFSKTLIPSSASCLLKARIECVPNPVVAEGGGTVDVYRALSVQAGSATKAFEFKFDQVELDLGRLVVAIEEGLSKGDGNAETVVMWLRR